MPQSNQYITIFAPLSYSESASGDIDTFTAYTDNSGQPSRSLWWLNQTGSNSWTGSISSGGGGDSADVIPIYVPTGYAISSYSLSISNVAINSSAMFDFGSSSGGAFDDNRALASFNSNTLTGAGSYNITIGGGVNVLDFTFRLNIIKVNEPPTVSEDAAFPTFYTGGSAVGLFSNTVVSTVEAGQAITKFSLTVDNVAAADSEYLTINGIDIHLIAGQSGTVTSGVTFATTSANGSVLVSLTMAAGISPTILEALIDNMTYKNTSANPTLGDRYVSLASISDNGGTANTGVDTSELGDYTSVTVAAPPNAAPVVTTAGGSTAFAEGAGPTSVPVVVDSGLTVTDTDNTTLASAKVSVSGNFHNDQDVLAFSNTSAALYGNISASYSSSAGELTLASSGGTATLAQWQAALHSVTYNNTSDAPNTGARTISFVVNDGTSDSVVATKAVTVTATNDAPVLATSNGTTAFTEGNNVTSTPVAIDNQLTLADPDNTTLASAKVIISGNFHSAEDVLSFTGNPATMGNISAVYNAATGELDLTSSGASATLLQWQAALRSVTYTDSSDTPNVATRTISFSVNDGALESTVSTKAVSVASVNDTPVANASGGISAFTESAIGASTPVLVDSGLTVSDLDSTTLASAKVSITGHFQIGEDVLQFVNNPATMGNISAAYDAGTGVLSLASSGSTATLAQWQAALRSVTYTDTSDTPDTGPRTVSFTVNDGTSNSAAVTKFISVTATNDAPVVISSSGAAAFTAGNNSAATPVAIDSQLTLNDPDNGTLSTATVSVTGNFKLNEDVLAFTNSGSAMGNISGSYNATTGMLSLASAGNVANLAQWQAALRSVTYTDTAELPDTATRTISFTVNDSQADSATVTKNVALTSVDQSPVLSTSGPTTAFIEGKDMASLPVFVDSGVTVTDLDSSTLASAKVTISNHKAGDILALATSASTGDITQSYDASTGVLTLLSVGAATLAQWQTALQTVSYTNTSDTPDTAPRTMSFVVNDGNSDSAAGTHVVSVASVNDSPSLVAGTQVAGFVEGRGPVAIDLDLKVIDPDSTTLASAQVSITTNFHSGQDVLAFTPDAGTGNISATYDADTGVLSLSSTDATASLAQWQAALQAVTYSNSSENPTAGDRTIKFVVNDGSDDSGSVTHAVSVLPVNDAPTISAPVASTLFTEDAGAVVINSGVLVADVDDSTLVGAKVSITDFVAGEDKLTLPAGTTGIGDIVATYVSSTGELSLTSASHATLAQWQAALSAVTYANTSQAPTGAARTITFSVNDGEYDSNVLSQTVNLVAVNDAPDITLGAATQNLRQNTTLVFNSGNHNQIVISDVDAGSSNVQVTLTAAKGLLTLGSITGLDVLDGLSANQPSITVTGTLAAINAGLNGLKFAPTTGFTGSASIHISVDDLGLSNGLPDPLTADKSVAITISAPPVTPVDPPVLVDGVPVTTTQVTLPNGETGSSVFIGLVTDSRQDSTGNASIADIDLVGSGSTASLSAKLPVGYGLTATSGAAKSAANSAETLKAAIDAVTPNTDQAHQNVNGQHFLDKLADNAALAVHTITPVTSGTGPTQALELDGSNGSLLTALVIDAGQMNGKGSLVLNHVDFAAIVGQATVQGNTTGQVLTGDDASQSFIVNGSDSFVFAGGGSDTLKITSFAAANNTVLQGGQGNDVVSFSGDRSLYNIEQHGGFTIVSNKDDPNQQVKIVNVESLSFADGAVAVPTDTQQTTLAALYEGLLGRQADVAGFDYWTQQPLSIGGIGLSILNSTEAGATALNGNTSHDIAAIYTAFFGRTADVAGQAYWTEQVEQGHLTFVQVADSLLTSTEMAGHNKAPATWDFTV